MLSKQALRVILSLTGADDFEAWSWARLAFLCYIHTNRTRHALVNVCRRFVLVVVLLTENS